MTRDDVASSFANETVDTNIATPVVLSNFSPFGVQAIPDIALSSLAHYGIARRNYCPNLWVGNTFVGSPYHFQFNPVLSFSLRSLR